MNRAGAALLGWARHNVSLGACEPIAVASVLKTLDWPRLDRPSKRSTVFRQSLAAAFCSQKDLREMPDEKSFHMTPEEFRRHGHAMVDWIADYQSRVESLPVLSQVKPGEIRAALPANPPAQGEPFDALLKDVERSSFPASPTGSRRIFSPTFPATRPAQEFWAIFFPPDSAFKACSGPPAPHAPNSRLTSWTGWSACSVFPKNSSPQTPAEASFKTPLPAPRSAPCWPRVSAPPTTPATRKDAMAASSPTRPPKLIPL